MTDEAASDSADLASAVMRLLPQINDAITAHRGGCGWCTPSSRRDCPMLSLAAVSLDLVIRCWRSTKAARDPAHAIPPRDLYAALRSQWLSPAESATLAEILGILDLAARQADAAGANLPVLAGIGIAVIDGYRAATTPSR